MYLLAQVLTYINNDVTIERKHWLRCSSMFAKLVKETCEKSRGDENPITTFESLEG